MLRVLRHARIPLFMHRKSNHIFTVWQHVVLLVIRQYEGKSYRLYVDWLVEAYYLKMVLQLSCIPHFTTLQKFTERISGTILQQIICTIKIRRARHDNIDFGPLITKTSEILPLSVVIGHKAYDNEVNHILVRDILHPLSVIPARYEHVPIRNTHGKYRKLMKHGYSKLLYSQRNKDETIISVIKRLFGEHITSRLVKTQNRELSFRCIAYNIHRLTNIVVISVVSTKPRVIKNTAIIQLRFL